MNSKKRWGWLAAVFALALAGCSEDGPTGPDGNDPGNGGSGARDFEWSGTVAPGQAIEIKGIIGSIHASSATGGQVEVSATKTGRDDPADVSIQVLQHAGGVTICAVYPDVPGQPSNECAPGLGGSNSTRDIDVEVTFTVRVPTGVHFVGRTVAGSVTASDLLGNAYGYTVAGNVELSTSRMAEAKTVTGSVDVSLGDTRPSRSLQFSTAAGNVTVRIPGSMNAEVHASAAAGSVYSDFPLTEVHRGSWEATLGSGGSPLSLSTAAGSVRLLRRN